MSQPGYAMKLTPQQPVEKIGWDHLLRVRAYIFLAG